MKQPLCELCGNPMPKGEEMFKFHGYSGDCPPKVTGQLATDTQQVTEPVEIAPKSPQANTELDEILDTLLDGSSTYDWEMVDVPERAEVAKAQLKALLIEQRIEELETMGRINALIKHDVVLDYLADRLAELSESK